VKAGTEPWHPDTDNDGLTDGQEARFITLVGGAGADDFADRDPTGTQFSPPTPQREPRSACTAANSLAECYPVGDLGTEPTTADSDGDGYWDGWIGVYGVTRENASQHILYRHNLEGGIDSDEILQRQLGTHPVDAAPTPPEFAATIEGGCPRIDGTTANSEQCHANVHVGERLLRSDPTSRDSEANGLPDTTVRLEVDFHENANSAVLNNQEAWLDRIWTNYQLYGINLQYVSEANGGNETLTQQELQQIPATTDSTDTDARTPWGRDDISHITDNENFHQTTHPYLLVGPRAGENYSPEESGIRRYSDNRTETEWMAVFTDPSSNNHDPSTVPNRLGLSEGESIRAATSKTTVHEIGHHLSLGENEDNDVPGDETYSGGRNDSTPENVIRTVGNSNEVPVWSVMSSGTDRRDFLPPTDAHYTALSIEELLTIDESRPE